MAQKARHLRHHRSGVKPTLATQRWRAIVSVRRLARQGLDIVLPLEMPA